MAARNRLSREAIEIREKSKIWDGGESGIRTLPPPLDSASYRFQSASVAVNAGDAVAHCTPLHAGPAVSPDECRSGHHVLNNGLGAIGESTIVSRSSRDSA